MYTTPSIIIGNVLNDTMENSAFDLYKQIQHL